MFSISWVPVPQNYNVLFCLNSNLAYGAGSIVDSDRNRIHPSPWIRIRIQEGKNNPQKYKKALDQIPDSLEMLEPDPD